VSSEPRISGQCLCGAVRFELAPPLAPMAHCHCRSCRLSHGAAFVTWTSVPSDRFAFVTGEADVAWYRSSPWIRWGACRACSSPMFYVADQAGHPEAPRLDYVYVTVASLTGGFDDQPVVHVSYEEHVSWIEGADGLPKVRGKSDERID
jgi:hypothetical protein